MSDTGELSEREEIETLLPWHVTGQLCRADAERVAAYLTAHPDMARQLALIREERAETEDAHEALPSPSSGGLDRLMRSIENAALQPTAAGRRRAPGAGWLSKVWRGAAELFAVPSPVAARWAAAAAVVVLVIQSAVIATLILKPGQEGDIYRPAQGDGTSAKGGATFLVTFARSATAQEITSFLMEFDAVIVDGPKPGGMYKVVVRGGAVDSKSLMKRFLERKDMVELVLPGGS